MFIRCIFLPAIEVSPAIVVVPSSPQDNLRGNNSKIKLARGSLLDMGNALKLPVPIKRDVSTYSKGLNERKMTLESISEKLSDSINNASLENTLDASKKAQANNQKEGNNEASKIPQESSLYIIWSYLKTQFIFNFCTLLHIDLLLLLIWILLFNSYLSLFFIVYLIYMSFHSDISFALRITKYIFLPFLFITAFIIYAVSIFNFPKIDKEYWKNVGCINLKERSSQLLAFFELLYIFTTVIVNILLGMKAVFNNNNFF